MTTSDKLEAAQALAGRRKAQAAKSGRMLSVQVFEGARLAEDAALNPDTLKTWLHQQCSRYDGRIRGITIHTDPEPAKDLGRMKGDR